MRSAFGQTRSAIGQMRTRLAKRARDLPNVAQLVKCRSFDQLVKCAARLPKCAAHLVNPTDSDQMCTQFAKRGDLI